MLEDLVDTTLDPQTRLVAVVAAVRHADTPYDELLMRGVDGNEARLRILSRVDEILELWREPTV